MTRAAPASFDAGQWRSLADGIVDAAERAAAACAPHIGGGDKIAADGAAVAAFAAAMNAMPFAVHIATGEGELDDAPMFSAGDRFGTVDGPAIDVAVDPLEGTTLCATGRPGSMTAIAAAPGGTIVSAPDGYMEKRMAGPDCPAELLDPERPIGDTILALARHLDVAPGKIGVCMLDKPRQQPLKQAILAAGARLFPIDDGDIPAAVWVCDHRRTGIHLYAGIGGTPEGVISAAALRCLGGRMTARFVARDAAQQRRLEDWPVALTNRIWTECELVAGPALFCITSVTGSDELPPLRSTDAGIVVDSLLLRPGGKRTRLSRCVG